jgi:hypothetical protein
MYIAFMCGQKANKSTRLFRVMTFITVLLRHVLCVEMQITLLGPKCWYDKQNAVAFGANQANVSVQFAWF